MSYLIQTAETNAFLQLVKFVANLLDEGQVLLMLGDLAIVDGGEHWKERSDPGFLQGRSALADTTGSRFVEDGETSIAKQQHQQLLSLLLSQAKLVFSKAAASGLPMAHMQFLSAQTSRIAVAFRREI